jgi:hypothetical protein
MGENGWDASRDRVAVIAVLLPVYLLLGAHAWYITTKIPRDPP